MTTLKDNFKLPVRAVHDFASEHIWVVADAEGMVLTPFLTKPQALALAEAINKYDQMREALERAKDELPCQMELPADCSFKWTRTNLQTSEQESCPCCAIRAALETDKP